MRKCSKYVQLRYDGTQLFNNGDISGHDGKSGRQKLLLLLLVFIFEQLYGFAALLELSVREPYTVFLSGKDAVPRVKS